MMKRTAFASRSNRVAQAWPNRATGATLPNGSSRRKSEGQISIPLHLHRSLQAPRSYKAIPRAYFRLQGPLARKPANNQYPQATQGNGLVHPSFRSPSRQSPSDCSPSHFRRVAGLKLLCIMFYTLRQKKGQFVAASSLGAREREVEAQTHRL